MVTFALVERIIFLFCASSFNAIDALFHILNLGHDVVNFNIARNITTQTVTECYMRCHEYKDCDDVLFKRKEDADLKICQMLRRKIAVKEKPCILKTFDAFSNTFIMDQYTSVPVTRDGNEFRYGDRDRSPFKKGEYFTYETKRSGNAGYQFFGWRSEEFSSRNITFKFSIYFERDVPRISPNFGFKVYGVMYNEWVKGCKPDTWCKVEKNVRVNKNGDKNQVILLFDSITDKRVIHFGGLFVDILK